MTLADQDTSVVDRLGKTELVDTGLETTLQEILGLQGQDVIESHAGFIEHTDTDETTNEGISFEETLGVLLIKSEKLTASSQFPGQMAQSCRLPRETLTEQHDESWKE